MPSQHPPELRFFREEQEVQRKITRRTIHSLETVERVYLVATAGLSSDTQFRLRVQTASGRAEHCFGRTLPSELSDNRPFTIGVGSCYNWPMDLKEVYRFFPPVRHRGDGPDPMRLRFLLGDQIYMDLEKKIDAERQDS